MKKGGKGMSKYIPKFDKDNKELLILDTIFSAKNCLLYADTHNMNVLFTDTTSTSAVEVMMDFQKSGYNHKLYEKLSYAPGGIELDPHIVCLFEKSKVKEIIDKI